MSSISRVLEMSIDEHHVSAPAAPPMDWSGERGRAVVSLSTRVGSGWDERPRSPRFKYHHKVSGLGLASHPPTPG